MKPAGLCEMCGHHVAVRQKSHIIAEGPKKAGNILMLCPTCHLMFDTHLKPKIFKAVLEAGLNGLPVSWNKSIYLQAAEKSSRALKEKLAVGEVTPGSLAGDSAGAKTPV